MGENGTRFGTNLRGESAYLRAYFCLISGTFLKVLKIWENDPVKAVFLGCTDLGEKSYCIFSKLIDFGNLAN